MSPISSRNYREFVAHRGERGGNIAEGCGGDGGAGKLLAEAGVDRSNLILRVRAVVIAAHLHGEGGVGAGQDDRAAIVVTVVDHRKRAAVGALPEEDIGNIGRRAGAVDADIQQGDTGCGERRDDAARVPGNVGHLCANRLVAEAGIERTREAESAVDHGAVEHLGLPTEGKRVPTDVAGGDGLFHGAALLRVCLLQVFVKQPGAGRPCVAVAACAAERGAGLDGLGIVDIEVLAHDRGLRIGEAHVEMALEGDQYAAHGGIRRIGREKRAAESASCGRGSGGEGCKFQEFASLHGFLRVSLGDGWWNAPVYTLSTRM